MKLTFQHHPLVERRAIPPASGRGRIETHRTRPPRPFPARFPRPAAGGGLKHVVLNHAGEGRLRFPRPAAGGGLKHAAQCYNGGQVQIPPASGRGRIETAPRRASWFRRGRFPRPAAGGGLKLDSLGLSGATGSGIPPASGRGRIETRPASRTGARRVRFPRPAGRGRIETGTARSAAARTAGDSPGQRAGGGLKPSSHHSSRTMNS